MKSQFPSRSRFWSLQDSGSWQSLSTGVLCKPRGTRVCRSLPTYCCLFHGTPPPGEIAHYCFTWRLSICVIYFFNGRGVQLLEWWTLFLPCGCFSRGRQWGKECRVPLPGRSLPAVGGRLSGRAQAVCFSLVVPKLLTKAQYCSQVTVNAGRGRGRGWILLPTPSPVRWTNSFGLGHTHK